VRSLDILKKKELRGAIIERLYGFYGEDISISVLKASLPLSGVLTDTELKSALYYLGGAGKEYIKVVINKSSYIDSLIWLTPKGVVLETLEEAGIAGCSTQVLTQVLNKSMVEADIENMLLYLESKKLIRCKSYENIRQGIKRTVYFITEKGIDFLDGNVAETGLAYG